MIRAQKISFAYGTKTVFEDISLQLEPGSCTVLLGASGVGKTTLLRCLSGLLSVDAGEVFIDDKPAHENLQRWRKQSAMIFQEHALVPHRNVLWHVCCGALSAYGTLRSLGPWRRDDIDKALHIIKQVGLEGRAFDRVRQLSGGQRQRVAIARALMQDPPCIFADEPVASLDPGIAHSILQLLRENVSANRCCLISLHQVDLALSVADRIIAIKDGGIVFDGLANEFTQDLQQDIFPSLKHTKVENTCV